MGWQNAWTRRHKGLIALILAIALIMPLFAVTGSAAAKKLDKQTGPLVDPVKIDSGYISGTVLADYGHKEKVRIYRGIPYAAPPVGEFRWKPPQPVTPWTGIKECTTFSASSPQVDVGFCPGPFSEDCLYLNVLTPAKNKNERLPVMVWFHGGGFSIGSGNQATYNYPDLAQNGAVVVTVNHRLNVMGLFAYPELSEESPNGVSGNYLLLDMIASLEWVQRNIKAFGGDPSNVTIFGQSGGAGKVDALMASPLAKGLFNRAIYQSGVAWAFPLADVEKRGEKLVEILGLTDSENVLADLRELPWEELVAANVVLGSGYHGLADTLVVDGYVLPDTPENIFKAGRQNNVPIITLVTLGELIADKTFLSMPEIIQAYKIRMNAVNKSGAKAYATVFSQVPSKWKEEGVLAYHGLEVYYQFGGLEDLAQPAHFYTFAQPSGAQQPDPGLTEADTKISNLMMDMWVQFAAKGDPSIKRQRLVDWPAWNEKHDRYLDITVPWSAKIGYSEIVSP